MRLAMNKMWDEMYNDYMDHMIKNLRASGYVYPSARGSVSPPYWKGRAMEIIKGVGIGASFFPFESFFGEAGEMSYLFRGETGERSISAAFGGLSAWGDNENIIAHTLYGPRDVRSAFIRQLHHQNL